MTRWQRGSLGGRGESRDRGRGGRERTRREQREPAAHHREPAPRAPGAAHVTKKHTALTHTSAEGTARMVDVSEKPETVRTARARGTIRMSMDAFEAIRSHQIAKGEVLSVARLAGVMAAKRTADLVPLCHPLLLEDVQVELSADAG